MTDDGQTKRGPQDEDHEDPFRALNSELFAEVERLRAELAARSPQDEDHDGRFYCPECVASEIHHDWCTMAPGQPVTSGNRQPPPARSPQDEGHEAEIKAAADESFAAYMDRVPPERDTRVDHEAPPPGKFVSIAANKAMADAETERLREAKDALSLLVNLKDGPRDARYEELKPRAWDAARAALARFGPASAQEPQGGDTRAETVAEVVARLRGTHSVEAFGHNFAGAADAIERWFGPASAQEPQEEKR